MFDKYEIKREFSFFKKHIQLTERDYDLGQEFIDKKLRLAEYCYNLENIEIAPTPVFINRYFENDQPCTQLISVETRFFQTTNHYIDFLNENRGNQIFLYDITEVVNPNTFEMGIYFRGYVN